MSGGHTLHFIALQGSRDQCSAQEFIKYIGQQSPAPLLESALGRHLCDSHCNSRTGWSLISSPMISAVNWASPMISAGWYQLSPVSLVQKFLLEQRLDLSIEQLLKTFALFVYQFLRGCGCIYIFKRFYFGHKCFFRHFWWVGSRSCESMHQNSVVAAGYYYILLRIRSSLLLIIDLVIMCNNDG